ncbi:MAG: hypothetical protein IJ794_18305 [Lachnospiraceae bacterium]|nr:hypothetical protein [Lachnospiraceae bacterium]
MGEAADIEKKIGDEEIIALFRSMPEKDQHRVLLQMREAEFFARLRTVTNIVDFNRNDSFDQSEWRFAVKYKAVFIARVAMAMFYVQTFEVRRMRDRGFWGFGDSREERAKNWAPYLEEVAEKLSLSEDAVRDIGCLFHFYFIPKAEQYRGQTVVECRQRMRENVAGQTWQESLKASAYEISRIKDLAKLYMTQRFWSRTKGEYCKSWGEWKAFWRKILASEEMNEVKRSRMIHCPRDQFAGLEREIVYSADTWELEDRKEAVLSAYAKLCEQRADTPARYEEIGRETGLTGEEVLVLDCFTPVCEVADFWGIPGKTESGEAEPGKMELGEAEPGKAGLGKTESGEAEPGEAGLGKTEPGETEPGKAEPGEAGL